MIQRQNGGLQHRPCGSESRPACRVGDVIGSIPCLGGCAGPSPVRRTGAPSGGGKQRRTAPLFRFSLVPAGAFDGPSVCLRVLRALQALHSGEQEHGAAQQPRARDQREGDKERDAEEAPGRQPAFAGEGQCERPGIAVHSPPGERAPRVRQSRPDEPVNVSDVCLPEGRPAIRLPPPRDGWPSCHTSSAGRGVSLCNLSSASDARVCRICSPVLVGWVKACRRW